MRGRPIMSRRSRHDRRRRAVFRGRQPCAIRRAKRSPTHCAQVAPYPCSSVRKPAHDERAAPSPLAPQHGLCAWGGLSRRLGGVGSPDQHSGRQPRLCAFAVRLAWRRARASDNRRGRGPPRFRERRRGGEVRPDRRNPALDRKTPSDAGERQRRLHRTPQRRQFTPHAAAGGQRGSRNRDGAHRGQPSHARQALECARPARSRPGFRCCNCAIPSSGPRNRECATW